MLFTGESERSIDQKLRVSIPSEMRAGFATGPGSNIVYAAPGPDGSVWLWPEMTFEKMASSFEQSLLPDEDVMDFEQLLFSQSRRIEIDKAGRIRLPEALLSLAGIAQQAYVIGVGDHLEVLNHEKWNSKRTENLAKLREIMKRARQKGGSS